MKIKNLLSGIVAIALVFTSCKDEKEAQAEKTVDTYVVYMDSLGNVNAVDAKANWPAIEAEYQMRSEEADIALSNLKDKAKAEERIMASRARYEELKAKMQADMDAENKAINSDPKQVLRDAYFGAGKIGQDMNFSWVNKDNILTVYNDFYNEFEKNKNSYSREDFDEIKAMYEALDAHKNTVEKEGLTSKDNRKIAELKLKFAPKFRWERMGAKADENSDAKE